MFRYHGNIKFTSEIEKGSKLPLLDVLVIHKDYEVKKTIYLKSTNDDIYLYCFDDQHLQNEIKHLKKVFRDINDYPNSIIKQTIEKLKNQNEMAQSAQVTASTE